MITKSLFICLLLLEASLAEPRLILSESALGLPLISLNGGDVPAFEEKIRQKLPPSYETHPQYRKLKDLLARYKAVSGEDSPLVRFKIQKTHAFFPKLVAKLQKLGYLEEAEGGLGVNAVMQALGLFQQNNGLPPSKTLTNPTLTLLNKPMVFWIRKVERNLERWQKMNGLHDRHVMINIPAFALYGFSQGEQQFFSPVIVGKKTHKTPCFRARIRSVFSHPTWYVPQRLIRENKIDSAVGTNGYVYSNGRLIQKPGAQNPLGCIKFTLESDTGILLHSTNKPKLFTHKRRAFSSGCVRVKDHMGVLHFLFEPKDSKRIKEVIMRKKSQFFKLESEIYCHIVYFTVWFDDKGAPIFYEDIYNRDASDDDEEEDEDEDEDEEVEEN